MVQLRDWNELEKRHRSFWNFAAVDRPLIACTYRNYLDTILVASVLGDGELLPERIDPEPILHVFDEQAEARELVGDDMIMAAEPLLGIPWLEAICGCKVFVIDGKSLWPEGTDQTKLLQNVNFTQDNPWFLKLLETIDQIVAYADGRYAVALSHMRGPADVLAALLGTDGLFLKIFDEPELIHHLSAQVSAVWNQVISAQLRHIPRYRGGYVVRQFGIWAPDVASWLQDDTSSMVSLRQYRKMFLPAFTDMTRHAYGTLHLHMPSLHLAEMFAEIENVRAVNVYFDDLNKTIDEAIPTLLRLQAKKVPLILAKDVYEGFNREEYAALLEVLSPNGLSVHVRGQSLEEAQSMMAYVKGFSKEH